MQSRLTLGEKLKDLRTERKLNLSDLANATDISVSTLQRMESEEDVRVGYQDIAALAKFYEVSADYLFGLSENRKSPNAEVSELRLSDGMIELLKSGKINNRLLCELVEHPDFIRFITDMEIYVDRLASMNINNMNLLVDTLRAEIHRRHDPEQYELYNRTLELIHVQEDEYFAHLLHNDLMAVLRGIRDEHKSDSLTAPDMTIADEVKQAVAEVESFKGSKLERDAFVLCKSLGINAKKLTQTELYTLIELLKKAKFSSGSSSKKKKK